jgi:hypothetical protein
MEKTTKNEQPEYFDAHKHHYLSGVRIWLL